MLKVSEDKGGRPLTRPLIGPRAGRLLTGAALLLVPAILLGSVPTDSMMPSAAPDAAISMNSSEWLEWNDAARLTFGAGSRVWVEGNSTVRGFTCETEQLAGGVDIEETGPATRVADLPDRVTAMTLSVPVATLECGNDTMNRHMLDALQSEEHDAIRFTMTRSEVVADGAAGTVMLEGTLRIAGQEQPILLLGNMADTEDGKVSVKGYHELDMTTYGVRPPRLMLGTMRVHDDVIVHYELTLQR